jgi:hypothetical protein
VPFVFRQRTPPVEQNPLDYRTFPPGTLGPTPQTPLVDRMRPPPPEPEESWLDWAPLAARVGGGIVGGTVGGVLGSVVPGAGTAAGGMLGGGAGSYAGEWIAQQIEKARGLREDTSWKQQLMQGALGAIPLGKIGTVAQAALKGGALGVGGHVGTELAEGRYPTVAGTATGAIAGGAFGAGAHGLLALLGLGRTRPGAPAPAVEGDIPIPPPPPSLVKRMEAGMPIPPNMRRAFPEFGPGSEGPMLGPEPPPPPPGPRGPGPTFWQNQPTQPTFPPTPTGFQQPGSKALSDLLRIREKQQALGVDTPPTPELAAAEAAAMQDASGGQPGPAPPPLAMRNALADAEARLAVLRGTAGEPPPPGAPPTAPGGLPRDPYQQPLVPPAVLPGPPGIEQPVGPRTAEEIAAEMQRRTDEAVAALEARKAALREPTAPPSLVRPLLPSGLEPNAPGIPQGEQLPPREDIIARLRATMAAARAAGEPRPEPTIPPTNLVRPLLPSGFDPNAPILETPVAGEPSPPIPPPPGPTLTGPVPALGHIPAPPLVRPLVPSALTPDVQRPALGDISVPPPPTPPANVRAFLIQRLGYTPEQVGAMSVEDAIRIGR